MEKVKCRYCPEEFDNWQEYFDHLRSEHPGWVEENKKLMGDSKSIREFLHKR